MPHVRTCPKCATELPAQAPSGLCPKCLLQAALDDRPGEEKRGRDSSDAQSAPPRFVLPTPAELSACFPQLEVLDLIGQGGMGAVYQARQTKLDRSVALKIIHPESATNPAFADRFNREARTLARLNHFCIVAVYDFGEVEIDTDQKSGNEPQQAGRTENTLYYLVMEYVEGTNLRQLMQTQKLTPEQTISVVLQICDALQFAHEEGVVHRDIKPENILVDSKGRVKIADFGLAKMIARVPGEPKLTATRQVMGTPHYMAPEQMESSRTVDHRADIYSLGVVFYEMLTGQIPAGHFHPPSKMTPIDARLDAVVLSAMAHDPDDRFQNVSELKASVESLLCPTGITGSRSWYEASEGGERPGLSTIVDRQVKAAWHWIAGDEGIARSRRTQTGVRSSPPFPGLLMTALAAIGCLTLLAPWLEVSVAKTADLSFLLRNARLASSAQVSLRGMDQWSGISVGAIFAAFAVMLLIVPNKRPPGWLRTLY